MANVAEPLVKYRVGAGAYAPQGWLALLRSEIGCSAEFRACGFVTRRQFVRNVVVRGGYRLVPESVAHGRLPAGRSRGAASAEPPARALQRQPEVCGWSQPGSLRRAYRASSIGDYVADLVVVGSGFFGLTVAERAATELGLYVTILERRHHLGRQRLQRGRPRDRASRSTATARTCSTPPTSGSGSTSTGSPPSPATSTGSSRTTRTRSTRCRSTSARSARSSVGRFSPDEARALVAEQASEFDSATAANLEEKAISLIGRPLYEAFIRGYTAEAVADRPDRAAGRDHHPAAGALHLRQPLLQRHLRGPAGRRLHRLAGADGRPPEHRDRARRPTSSTTRTDIVGQVPVVYTGPVDRYFDYSEGRLGWRTLDFEREVSRPVTSRAPRS